MLDYPQYKILHQLRLHQPRPHNPHAQVNYRLDCSHMKVRRSAQESRRRNRGEKPARVVEVDSRRIGFPDDGGGGFVFSSQIEGREGGGGGGGGGRRRRRSRRVERPCRCGGEVAEGFQELCPSNEACHQTLQAKTCLFWYKNKI